MNITLDDRQRKLAKAALVELLSQFKYSSNFYLEEPKEEGVSEKEVRTMIGYLDAKEA